MNGKTKAANAGTFAASYKSLINNQQTFNTKNYIADPALDTRKNGKVVRLYRCFDCDGCFSIKMMSGFLMICKHCLTFERIGDKRSRERFVEKMLNKIGVFLRRRV